MNQTFFSELPIGSVRLIEGPLHDRFQLNKTYVMSLTNENLLRNFNLEAGLWSYSGNGGTTSATTISMDGPEHWHWGWESPTCELRGHMMGHWLSAAARIYAQTGDGIVKSKADAIVEGLGQCQSAIGTGWLAAFPETYMHRAANGKWVWAPHYTVHKLLMGLHEMYALAGNQQALAIMTGIADWFYQWSGEFDREEMDDLLDIETGGMLEVWADLYGITENPKHRKLIERYERSRFFDALLEGRDVLTNKHANTQIPEILGAARAWEVTGEERYRNVVEAFWKCAVTDRGYVATGAGDDAELWLPRGNMTRMGVGQEHCVNYNMMRLSHTLLRWTGDAAYADYWERRFINGVLAHQHDTTGMIAYFLGIGAGSSKNWGKPTQHFWCCHGTLVQANAAYTEEIFMKDEQGVAVLQWLPASMTVTIGQSTFGMTIRQDGQQGVYPLHGWNVEGMRAITQVHVPPIPEQRPDRFVYEIQITSSQDIAFRLLLRLPWWVTGQAEISVNGVNVEGEWAAASYAELERTWMDGDIIRVILSKSLTLEELPGDSGTYAFMDGPIVLAGLVGEDHDLQGDAKRPETLLTPDRERNHSWWNTGYYRTWGDNPRIRFIPLYEIRDQQYTLYFQMKQKSESEQVQRG